MPSSLLFRIGAACRYERVSEAITTCEEWDEVEIVGKIINLRSPHLVQQKGQNVSTTIDVWVLTYGTQIFHNRAWVMSNALVLWGFVFGLEREKISTTINTRDGVTVVEDESCNVIAVEDCDKASKLGEEGLEIDNILSVEKVEHSSKCVNCRRKLVQVTFGEHCTMPLSFMKMN